MAEFEIVSQSTEYETMLHGVMPVRGISFEDYHETSGVGIDPVKKMLIDELPGFINQLAWVDLTKRASVNIRHNEPRVVKPYGLPDYPDEVVSGRRVSYGDSYFVTDRDDQELECRGIRTKKTK